MSPGRWVDVTLYTRNSKLAEAEQSVPAGFLRRALKLQSPKETRGTAPDPGDERTTEPDYERPKVKLLLYWGCGETVRAGQPRLVDFAPATPVWTSSEQPDIGFGLLDYLTNPAFDRWLKEQMLLPLQTHALRRAQGRVCR